MLSQTSEYALCAMVWLAEDWMVEKGQARPVAIIASSTQVPSTYLLKILQALTRRGLLQKKRGIKGGFYLAVEPDQISLLSIIELFDSIERITSCPLKLLAHKDHLCPLHHQLDEIACHLRTKFSTLTLAGLIHQQRASLCTH